MLEEEIGLGDVVIKWKTRIRVNKFDPKVGQISPKWDNSGIFFRSDSESQNVLNLI